MRFFLFPILLYFKQGLLTLSIVLITSCGGGNDSSISDKSYTIKVIHDPSITLTDAKIKFTLYGTNKLVSDNTASVISETVLTIKKLPSSLVLSWPENAYQLIKNPVVKSKENAIYYFSINIDENNDDLLCNNDYSQDYKNTPFYTINDKPSKVVDFNLKLRKNAVCEAF